MAKNGFTTKAVHEGELMDRRFGNVVTPIFQNVTFLHPNEYEDVYLDPSRNKPFLYSRLGNPTLASLEKKYASIENSRYALSFSSGMSAITTSILSLVKQGYGILAVNQLYGQTYEFFKEILPSLGVKVDFISMQKLNELEIPRGDHKMIYVESITNPTLQVCDIVSLARYCREEGITLVVDATFATPYNQRPLELGADMVLHSGTKYISGHSDILIGFFATNEEQIYKNVLKFRDNLGGVPDPLSAYLALRSIKTLSLRIERQQANALKLAKFLRDHKRVKRVYYPGLEDNEYHGIAKKVLKGFGAMLSFDLGSKEAAKKFMKNLKLCITAPSLGGVETLVTLPLETSHRMLDPEESKRMGISEGLVRVSLGIEDYEDIENDFNEALDSI